MASASGWLLFSLLGAVGCGRRVNPEPPRADSATLPSAPGALVEPYPPGRWRLSVPADLERALVWAAHIQISHRDVVPRVAIFHVSNWTPRASNPSRSRQEAFELASSIAARPRAAPAEFARWARELSDDVASRDRGGELGALTALKLARWPEILDALYALEEGEVSRVVESEFGFHVLVRRPPPPPLEVSGERIIIGYDEAPWLHEFLARRPIPPRSRAQALELAASLHGHLALHPEEWGHAVERHSDHRDALRGGDLGQWSTRELSPWHRELDVLRGLEVGEIAPPLDSPFGVQILRRTPLRPRETYAMAALTLKLDPGQRGPAEGSLEAARRTLAEVASAAARDPAAFDAARARTSPGPIEVWVQGRGNVLAEAALGRLSPGEISPEPVALGTAQLGLLRRLPAQPAQPRSANLELPSPSAPDIEWFASTYGDAPLLGGVGERARRVLGLDARGAALLDAASAPAREFLEAPGGRAREVAFRAYQAELEGALGASAYARYRRVFEDYVTERLLRRRVLDLSRSARTGLRSSGWPLL